MCKETPLVFLDIRVGYGVDFAPQCGALLIKAIDKNTSGVSKN